MSDKPDAPDYFDVICDRLATVQPDIRNEPQAYKRAVIRMALAEHMKLEHEIMASAFDRHG